MARKETLPNPPVTARLFLLSCLVALSGAGCRPRSGAAPPRMVLETTRIDLGDVDAGESARTEFRLRNTGGGMLRLQKVEGNCGCLSPSYPAALAPRGTGEILVRFEPAANWSGPMERSLKVFSNDPATPVQELTLAARVVPLLAMEPPSPLPLPYRRGEVLRRQVRLTPRADSSLQIHAVASASPLIKGQLRPPAPGQRTYLLDLAIGPCNGPGDFNADVNLLTTDRNLSIAVYTVKGQAQTGAVVDPPSVLVPMVTGNVEGAELKRLKVFSRSGALQLLGAAVDHPRLRVEIVPTNPGRAYDLVLRIVRPLPPGPLDTVVRVSTDDPNAPTIAVKVEGAVPEPAAQGAGRH
jgi:hypothetical protein